MKRIAIICVVLVCFIPFVYFAVLAIAIWGEYLFVKLDIDNPYVNSRYTEWRQVSVEDFSSFYIPNQWELHNDNGLYIIKDEKSDIWAYGFAIGTQNDRYESYEEFFSEVYSTQSVTITNDPFISFEMMDGSDIDVLIVQENNTINKYYCIQMLETAQTYLIWILISDNVGDETQYDIAEAIVYSFAYEVGGEAGD